MKLFKTSSYLKSVLAIGLAVAFLGAAQVAPAEAGSRKRAAIAAGLIIGGIALYHASRHNRHYRHYRYAHRYPRRRVYYTQPRYIHVQPRHYYHNRHGHVYYHSHFNPSGQRP